MEAKENEVKEVLLDPEDPDIKVALLTILHALKHIFCKLSGTVDHGLQIHVTPTSDLVFFIQMTIRAVAQPLHDPFPTIMYLWDTDTLGLICVFRVLSST